MITIENITNMIDAEMYIHEAAKEHFFNGKLGTIQKMEAKKNGKLEEYFEMEEILREKFKREKTQWKKNFCEKNFSRFSHTELYKILMGFKERDPGQYGYQPIPF